MDPYPIVQSIAHDPYPQSSMILHDSLLCWCLVVPCDPDWSCDLQPAWKIWKAKTLSTSWDPGRSRFSYHCGMGLVEQYVVHLKFSLQPNTTCVYTQMWRGVVWCDTSWIYVYITYVIIYKNLLIHLPIIYYLYIITPNFVHWSDHTKVVVAGLKEGLKPWKSPKRLASAVFERTRLCIFCRKLL